MIEDRFDVGPIILAFACLEITGCNRALSAQILKFATANYPIAKKLRIRISLLASRGLATSVTSFRFVSDAGGGIAEGWPLNDRS